MGQLCTTWLWYLTPAYAARLNVLIFYIELFASIFIREIGPQFVLFVYNLLSYRIKLMMALKNGQFSLSFYMLLNSYQ